jgi:DNA-binding NarL/FixJ family response regulator
LNASVDGSSKCSAFHPEPSLDVQSRVSARLRLSLPSNVVAPRSRTTNSIGLAALWRELVIGSCTIRDSFCSQYHFYLITGPVAGPWGGLEPKHLQVLEAFLTGVAQKAIAMDLDVAPSTVASYARSALRHLGVHDRPSQVQPLLILAAKASQSLNPTCRCDVTFLHETEPLRVVAFPRPDSELPTVPPAELSVLRCLVEGMTHSEIARRRGTAIRTVANQLASVFSRFRVSGRRELILRLFELDSSSYCASGAQSSDA